jgi:cobalamin biosynthesis protein CobW
VDQKLTVDPQFLNELEHRHHSDIASMAFKFDRPFVIEKFENFVQDLSSREKVYRSKGIISIAGNPRRAVFHGVNNRFTLFWDRLWEKTESRQSQLVFIGKGLHRESVEKSLATCLAS